MTDPRIEAAIDAVLKARCWRDRTWGDRAIGRYDYTLTPEKPRYVIRDHEAEEVQQKTVVLFETESAEEASIQYERAVIRRELVAAIRAADAAAWKPIDTAPDGEIWCRKGDVVALVTKSTTHSVLSYGGWAFACGLPTHWKYPDQETENER